MPVIALTAPLYTDTRDLFKSLQGLWDCRVYGDDDIITKTARDHQIPPDLLTRVVQVSPIAFNNFTHEREKALAALEKTMADLLVQGDCIFSGLISHLIPDRITHVFRILAVSGKASRIQNAVRLKGCSQEAAAQDLKKADQDGDQWVKEIKKTSLWDESIYTLVLNLDKSGPEAVNRIQSLICAPPYTGGEPRARQVADLSVSAAVQLVLARLGGGLRVSADAGHVIVTIEKRRMNLPQTQSEIMTSAKKVPGVISVKTRIGATYYKSEMIKAFDLGPSTGGP